MHDDEGRAFMVHYDNSLVPGDRLAGMPGNPHFLCPDRRHLSMIPRNRTEPYHSVRLCSLAGSGLPDALRSEYQVRRVSVRAERQHQDANGTPIRRSWNGSLVPRPISVIEQTRQIATLRAGM